MIHPLTRIADKTGVLGAVVSGIGCAMCFPALASLGATVGLGILAPWERLFITTLLPLFTVIALVANSLLWGNHRQWYRGLPGVLGPLLVLVGLLPFLLRLGVNPFYGHLAFYTGLALMVISAVWDLLRPASRQCTGPRSADIGATHEP